MGDCIERQFEDAYSEWVHAPIEPNKIDADKVPTTNAQNPIFQVFVAVPEELQSARHKAWKRYVEARTKLLEFYCSDNPK